MVGTRKGLRTLPIAAALIAVSCTSEPPVPMNAVVICLDTVRYDAFHLTETTDMEDALSPWLERALRFRRAQSPAPWTLPAVASLMTGRYPNSHGAGSYVGTHFTLDQRLPPPLREDVPTLAEHLRSRGYLAHGFVAQAFFHPQFGLRRGFERMDFDRDGEALMRALHHRLDALEAIAPSPPSLLYLHFMEAHREHMQPPESFAESLRSMPPELERAALELAAPNLCTSPSDRPCLTWLTYVNAILKLRARVAEILTILDQRGWLDHSVVLVYSDHGEEFLEHLQEEKHRRTDSRGIHGFGHGQSLYQELLHVPLLVWHPEEPGRDIEHRVSLVDVAPTLAAWLGEDLELEWDGRDLLSAAGPEEHPVFASEIAFGPAETSVAVGRWKRIRRSDPEEKLLFDLESDPGERTPVSRSEVERDLDALITGYEAAARPNADGQAELSTQEIEELRALGYVQELEAE